MAKIQHFFETRKIEMTDKSVLWELVTPDGERVAAASTEEAIEDLEIALNMALTDAMDANPDIT
jgi:hypothetical protein